MDVAQDLAKRLEQAEQEFKLKASELAQDIVIDAMLHGATDYVAEYTISTITLTSDSVKGSIIGQGGRNIAAFEKATGVEIELEEGNSLRLSSFDSLRREIARRSLEILIRDGRITPTRIEEVVAHTRTQMDAILVEEGRKICSACGVYNLHPDLVKIIGRYRFRFSYGQNMIQHTLEETRIGLKLAYEVGADPNIVRLGCLLHDIGKVIDEEEGTHVELGVEFLKKYRIPQPVIDCVAEHHEDKPFSSVESVIVYVADAISGSRPGARYEDYDEYVKRLTKLEEVARSFEGVKEAFAIQAGREVRVIIDPQKVNDAQTIKLAHFLKTKIQKELTYPGTVKVNVIREVRATEVAT